ncbi:hypothetical protein MJT46_008819 [Ovis ammon polii x Ovis aries]|nr:hypothetical protein MJT46_008819 [Ovis ammon polii x Ovis aries]
MDTAHPRPGQRLQRTPLEMHPDEMQRAHGVPHSRGHPDTLDGPGCSGAPCCCSRVGSSWGPYKNHPEVGVQRNREKLTENESDAHAAGPPSAAEQMLCTRNRPEDLKQTSSGLQRREMLGKQPCVPSRVLVQVNHQIGASSFSHIKFTVNTTKAIGQV